LLGCSTAQGQHDRGGLPCHHSGIGATASQGSGSAPSPLLLVRAGRLRAGDLGELGYRIATQHES
jgi:hypothetical protein